MSYCPPSPSTRAPSRDGLLLWARGRGRCRCRCRCRWGGLLPHLCPACWRVHRLLLVEGCIRALPGGQRRVRRLAGARPRYTAPAGSCCCCICCCCVAGCCCLAPVGSTGAAAPSSPCGPLIETLSRPAATSSALEAMLAAPGPVQGPLKEISWEGGRVKRSFALLAARSVIAVRPCRCDLAGGRAFPAGISCYGLGWASCPSLLAWPFVTVASLAVVLSR